MENRRTIKAIGALMFLTATMYSQSDSLGMPGDNLDLKAVLGLFKQSETVEDFERRLNSADSKVNNLDLNGDNQVDYLRVVDYGKDDFHSIVIQDLVSSSESQDVAVIQVVKKDKEEAHIQIVGDEILYGKDYIIEPDDQVPSKKTVSEKHEGGNDDVYETDNTTTRVMVNVWAWPGVMYMYSPAYVYWSSPWYYGYYPTWYSPWRPYTWQVYHHGFIGYNYGFYGYRRYHYAFPHVHKYYYGRRVTSGYVQKTAPNYGRRTLAENRKDGREMQRNNTHRKENSIRNGNADNSRNGANTGRKRDDNSAQRQNTNRTQRTNERGRGAKQGSIDQNPSRGGGHKMNGSQRSGGNMGGGGRSNGGGRSQNR